MTRATVPANPEAPSVDDGPPLLARAPPATLPGLAEDWAPSTPRTWLGAAVAPFASRAVGEAVAVGLAVGLAVGRLLELVPGVATGRAVVDVTYVRAGTGTGVGATVGTGVGATVGAGAVVGVGTA